MKPSVAVSVPASRVCSTCGRNLPIEQFRKRKVLSNERCHNCAQCHVAYERNRRNRNREKARLQAMRQATQRLSHCDSVGDAAGILRGLSEAFGGNGVLFNWWHKHVQENSASNPEALLTFCRGLWNAEVLWDAMATQRYRQLNSREGRVALQEELETLIRERPQIAIQAARELGCVIQWPTKNGGHIDKMDIHPSGPDI